MKSFYKKIVVILTTAFLTGCGNSPETPENSKEITKETLAEQASTTETAEEVTTCNYSEAKAKIEALQERVKPYSIFSEKEKEGSANIIMTEYSKSIIDSAGWIFYAVNDEDKVCYEDAMNMDVLGRCVASPDGDTKYYLHFTGPYGTYKFYATYCSEFYDICYYKESEPIVIDESTLIEDSTFYTDRTILSYYFNVSNLLGDTLYDCNMALLDAQFADGVIESEEKYYKKKSELESYYKG